MLQEILGLTVLVKPSTPAFPVAYAAWPVLPCVPVVEETLMMHLSLGRPPALISFLAASLKYGVAAYAKKVLLSDALEGIPITHAYKSLHSAFKGLVKTMQTPTLEAALSGCYECLGNARREAELDQTT